MKLIFFQPFTHGFPCADIHELIMPDILHQLIKGIFKDYLVTWMEEYLVLKHRKAHALQIIQDIDQRHI
jgi:Plavaka transposase